MRLLYAYIAHVKNNVYAGAFLAYSLSACVSLGAIFNKTSSQWTFPSWAILEFGFLDADEDKYRYMGRQFSFIGWDELTCWPGDGTDAQGQPVSSAYVYMLSRFEQLREAVCA